MNLPLHYVILRGLHIDFTKSLVPRHFQANRRNSI
jgi:hypothetical protein